MSAFLFTVWRLGLARARYDAVGGWRRLFWRFWWRTAPVVPRVEAAREFPPPVLPPPAVLHWSPNGDGLPLCPATRREPWTVDYEFSTCADCRREGLRLYVHYYANTR